MSHQGRCTDWERSNLRSSDGRMIAGGEEWKLAARAIDACDIDQNSGRNLVLEVQDTGSDMSI